MPQAGFEPAIPASEQPLAHALDRAAISALPFRTRIGIHVGTGHSGCGFSCLTGTEFHTDV